MATNTVENMAGNMTEFQVRMRLPPQIKQGEIIDVKIKIDHPSSTGLELNQDAPNAFERFTRTEPATFIRIVKVFYNEALVNTFEMNSSTSDEPLIVFKLRAIHEGNIRIIAINQVGDCAEVSTLLQFV